MHIGSAPAHLQKILTQSMRPAEIPGESRLSSAVDSGENPGLG